MLKRFIATLTLFLAAAAVYALPARAQSTSSNVSLALTSGAVTVSNPFPNVGQSSHQLYSCLSLSSGSAIDADVELEASTDGVNYFAISPVAALTVGLNGGPTPCLAITANGYYASVRARVFGVTGSGSPTGVLTGTYSGSVGSSLIGGEPRSGSAAEKVSPVPIQTEFESTDLLSAGAEFLNPDAGASTSAAYVYGVVVNNPNASVVYVSLGSVQSPAFNGSSIVSIPVAASSVATVMFPSPVYFAGGSAGAWIGCATDLSGSVDPGTGCIVRLLMNVVPGVNSTVNAGGAVSHTDNSPGNSPH